MRGGSKADGGRGFAAGVNGAQGVGVAGAGEQAGVGEAELGAAQAGNHGAVAHELVGDDANIVAYCRGPYCVMASTAVSRLRESGFEAARLEGGYPEWRDAGRPIAAVGSA